MSELFTISVLLVVAVVLLASGRAARRAGLPEALGFGGALCVMGLGAALAPANWQAWWAGGYGGDRLLTFARVVGLTGILFLAGTRFDSGELRKRLGLMLGLGLAAGVLFAVVTLLLKLLGQDTGPIVVVAATVVASSIWFPGELSHFDKESRSDLSIGLQAGAVVLTALAMLAVYFYDVFGVIGHAPLRVSAYLVLALYESVKLIVFFAFAYFISTRFLSRAQGRISAARTTIGFVLISGLIFALAVITINQPGAIAWAFLAGALWRGSEFGKRFSESERPLASATLISFVFVSLMLQSHGRTLTGLSSLVVVVLAAIVLKSAFVWVGARAGGAKSRDATCIAALMVGSGELAIMFLGFGMTRWAIDGSVYFGILSYALLSSLLVPLVWHFETSQKWPAVVIWRRRNAMKIQRVLHVWIALLTILTLSGKSSSAQQDPGRLSSQEVQLGSGMSVITPGLMEIGSKTRLFLVFGDKIPVTVEQRKKLEDLYFRIQMYSFQREADLDVADAELKRLLTRDTVDLGAVKSKMKEIEDIRVEVDIKKIETLLQAINALTHEQHTQIILLARDLEEASKPRAPIYQ